MIFEYTPYRLSQAKDDISAQHPIDNIIARPNRSDKNLETLIVKLIKLKESQVKVHALALTKNELRAVVSYLPYNFYSVDMTNLFKVFKYRINSDLCSLFYYHWQDSYYNNECNNFLIAESFTSEPSFSNVFQNNHISTDEFKSFLLNGDIPTKYGLKAKEYQFPKGTTFKDKLEHFGIRSNSRLYKDCEFVFYTFCSIYDYLNSDRTKLLNTIKMYNSAQVKAFLKNFLPLFKNNTLSSFSNLLPYLESLTDLPNTDKFNSFFKDFPIQLIKKYVDWLNTYKINYFFGNDERSRFWSKFSFVKVDKHKYSNSIIMEFENHIAIEFLGKAMGPIYIYEKKYFNDKIRRWFNYGEFNNAEMRKQLLDNTQYGDGFFYDHGYRKEHRGDWKYVVEYSLIRTYKITTLIDK